MALRLLRLVGNREIAEELHQETFLRAWTHLSNMRDDTGFCLWLYRIAANLAIDYLRHANKFEFVPLLEEGEEHGSVARLSIEGPEERVCQTSLIDQALAKVAPQFRACLLLQDQWGFSQREIAKLLNISVGCVGAYIYRGREQFRQAFRQSMIEIGGGLQ